MAKSAKYGNPEIEGIGTDEPVLIIRAKDLLAVPGTNGYGDLARANDRDPEFVESVYELGAEMKEWQEQHPDLVKLPD